VDQLNDTTLFPLFLHVIKNFSSDYRKNKSDCWDFLISIHDLKNLKRSVETSDAVRQQQINYLIGKYNERLLFYSIDKENPWVIDSREKKFITLHKKRYLEIERNLSQIIEEEIAKGLNNHLFTEKWQTLERKRLYQLAKLALLADYRAEENNLRSDIMFLNWHGAEDRFKELIQKKTDYDSIQQEIKEIKKQRKAAIKELSVRYSKASEAIEFYSTNTIWEKVNNYVNRSKILGFFSAIWSAVSGHANVLSCINFLLLFFSLSIYSYPIIFIQ
jgi:hypothetical protein